MSSVKRGEGEEQKLHVAERGGGRIMAVGESRRMKSVTFCLEGPPGRRPKGVLIQDSRSPDIQATSFTPDARSYLSPQARQIDARTHVCT